MPCDYRDYHPEWRSIRRQIVEQAGNACEFCGVANGATVERPGGRSTRVVLTVAHLCHDTTCTDPTHLRALCQRDHLAWDSEHHRHNAAATRRRKRVERGQVEMGVTA